MEMDMSWRVLKSIELWILGDFEAFHVAKFQLVSLSEGGSKTVIWNLHSLNRMLLLI